MDRKTPASELELVQQLAAVFSEVRTKPSGEDRIPTKVEVPTLARHFLLEARMSRHQYPRRAVVSEKAVRREISTIASLANALHNALEQMSGPAEAAFSPLNCTFLAKLLFLPLLKRASDFAAFAMVNAPAEAVTQFSVVELGQNAAAERRVVDIAQYVDCLGDPADFGKCARQGGWLIPDLECSVGRKSQDLARLLKTARAAALAIPADHQLTAAFATLDAVAASNAS